MTTLERDTIKERVEINRRGRPPIEYCFIVASTGQRIIGSIRYLSEYLGLEYSTVHKRITQSNPDRITLQEALNLTLPQERRVITDDNTPEEIEDILSRPTKISLQEYCKRHRLGKKYKSIKVRLSKLKKEGKGRKEALGIVLGIEGKELDQLWEAIN